MNKAAKVMIGVTMCVLLTACGMDGERMEEKLNDKGYNVEISENGEVRITEGDFSYFYTRKKLLFVNAGYDLDRVEASLEEKSPREDTDNEPGKFVMYKVGKKSVDIYLTFNEYFGGKDDDYEENEYHIPLKGGFGEDDLQTTAVADFEREYYILTKYYISGDELEDVYDRGLELLESLNK